LGYTNLCHNVTKITQSYAEISRVAGPKHTKFVPDVEGLSQLLTHP